MKKLNVELSFDAILKLGATFDKVPSVSWIPLLQLHHVDITASDKPTITALFSYRSPDSFQISSTEGELAAPVDSRAPNGTYFIPSFHSLSPNVGGFVPDLGASTSAATVLSQDANATPTSIAAYQTLDVSGVGASAQIDIVSTSRALIAEGLLPEVPPAFIFPSLVVDSFASELDATTPATTVLSQEETAVSGSTTLLSDYQSSEFFTMASAQSSQPFTVGGLATLDVGSVSFVPSYSRFTGTLTVVDTTVTPAEFFGGSLLQGHVIYDPAFVPTFGGSIAVMPGVDIIGSLPEILPAFIPPFISSGFIPELGQDGSGVECALIPPQLSDDQALEFFNSVSIEASPLVGGLVALGIADGEPSMSSYPTFTGTLTAVDTTATPAEFFEGTLPEPHFVYDPSFVLSNVLNDCMPALDITAVVITPPDQGEGIVLGGLTPQSSFNYQSIYPVGGPIAGADPTMVFGEGSAAGSVFMPFSDLSVLSPLSRPDFDAIALMISMTNIDASAGTTWGGGSGFTSISMGGLASGTVPYEGFSHGTSVSSLTFSRGGSVGLFGVQGQGYLTPSLITVLSTAHVELTGNTYQSGPLIVGTSTSLTSEESAEGSTPEAPPAFGTQSLSASDSMLQIDAGAPITSDQELAIVQAMQARDVAYAIVSTSTNSLVTAVTAPTESISDSTVSLATSWVQGPRAVVRPPPVIVSSSNVVGNSAFAGTYAAVPSWLEFAIPNSEASNFLRPSSAGVLNEVTRSAAPDLVGRLSPNFASIGVGTLAAGDSTVMFAGDLSTPSGEPTDNSAYELVEFIGSADIPLISGESVEGSTSEVAPSPGVSSLIADAHVTLDSTTTEPLALTFANYQRPEIIATASTFGNATMFGDMFNCTVLGDIFLGGMGDGVITTRYTAPDFVLPSVSGASAPWLNITPRLIDADFLSGLDAATLKLISDISSFGVNEFALGGESTTFPNQDGQFIAPSLLTLSQSTV